MAANLSRFVQPDSAEHDPDYREVGRFPSREKAEKFLASIDVR
jgi:hypothetical protein